MLSGPTSPTSTAVCQPGNYGFEINSCERRWTRDGASAQEVFDADLWVGLLHLLSPVHLHISRVQLEWSLSRGGARRLHHAADSDTDHCRRGGRTSGRREDSPLMTPAAVRAQMARAT